MFINQYGEALPPKSHFDVFKAKIKSVSKM